MNLEVLGWGWAAFLVVFAIVMGILVVVDELNYSYGGDER